MISIASRLKSVLEAKKLTQGAFAQMMTMSDSAVSQWVGGGKEPTRDSIEKAADVLEVDAAWLEYGSGPEPEILLEALRAEHFHGTSWSFRKQPSDGGRDYGNSNIWSIDWSLGSLAREAIQNSLDAALDPDIGVSIEFALISLKDDDLKNFLKAIKWEDASDASGLHTHISEAANGSQKISNILRDGLRSLDDSEELVLLRITDLYTSGLRGDETGEGNFAALMRNNLDSSKANRLAGGAYGLGKSVFWRASRLATVIANTNLSEPMIVSGRTVSKNRILGKSELAWHKANGTAYAGPGWFGLLNSSSEKAESVWENRALAKDLYIDIPSDQTGTSVLVVGFSEEGQREQSGLHENAKLIESAVGENFWPALNSGRLKATIKTLEGHEIVSSLTVEGKKLQPNYTDAYSKYINEDYADRLEKEGDVVVRPIILDIPERTSNGLHSSVSHEAMLVVRHSGEEAQGADANKIVYFRGQEMIVVKEARPNLVIGGAPFQAFVMCGTAVSDAEDSRRAEQFLRAAEPPAHDYWELTDDVRIDYKRGGGASINRFMTAVRDAIAEMIKPTHSDLDDGPRALKELLRIRLDKPDPQKKPTLRILPGKTVLNLKGEWVIAGIIRVPTEHSWWVEPVLYFNAEQGRGQKVAWDLTAVNDGEVKGDKLFFPAGIREVEFLGRSVPASHPADARTVTASVVIKSAYSEGA